MKQCRICLKNEGDVSFYKNRHVCKECFTGKYNKYNCKKCGFVVNKNSHHCRNCKKINLEKNGKKCCKCNIVKKITEFSKIKTGGKLYRSNCRICETENTAFYRKKNIEKYKKQQKKWRNKNPDSVKKTAIRTFLRKRNQIENLEEVVEKIFNQTECECCGKSFDKSSDKHMDHCHETNVFRGVICRSCNHCLGHCKDSIETLKNCIEYLKKSRE